MPHELTLLSATAASVGLIHTLLGPDHYLPFVVMAQANKWRPTKTILITFLCGVGHITSSVLLGILGMALGLGVRRLKVIESSRGEFTAWLLIAFGLIYFVWGLRRALRNRPHAHRHGHIEEETHTHVHTHTEEHLHVHGAVKEKSFTPWALFIIFILGPCEPLIPLLMYPAAMADLWGMALVTGLFAGATIATMLGIVSLATFGLNLLPIRRLERYAHALAGATICLCGAAIQFFRL